MVGSRMLLRLLPEETEATSGKGAGWERELLAGATLPKGCLYFYAFPSVKRSKKQLTCLKIQLSDDFT